MRIPKFAAEPCSIPPACTYRSRCLRVWPGLVAELALGCTCRTCWRTCLICFLPNPCPQPGVYRSRDGGCGGNALRGALRGIDRGHQHAPVVCLAAGSEGPRAPERRV